MKELYAILAAICALISVIICYVNGDLKLAIMILGLGLAICAKGFDNTKDN